MTTKTDGAGIGLALSRQSVEGQDGKLSLETRRPQAKAGAKGRSRASGLPLVVP